MAAEVNFVMGRCGDEDLYADLTITDLESLSSYGNCETRNGIQEIQATVSNNIE